MKNGRPALYIDKEVCDRIRSARKSAKLTQKQLADQLDVSVQSVKNWEQGINGTDDSTLKKIAEICGVDFVWLKNIEPTVNHDMTVGARIGSLLKVKRMTQRELSEHLGVDFRMVNRWIVRDVTPNSKHLLEIAAVLDVTPEFLMGECETTADSFSRISLQSYTTDELLAELKRRTEAP